MRKKTIKISKDRLCDRTFPGQSGHGRGLGVLILFSVLVLMSLTAHSQSKVRQLFDIRIPMRDGVELSADIWLPLEEGRYPVILMVSFCIRLLLPTLSMGFPVMMILDYLALVNPIVQVCLKNKLSLEQKPR